MSETTDTETPAAETAAPDDELAKARALIAAENARRIQECGVEIQAVLDRYGLKLEAVGVLQLGPA